MRKIMGWAVSGLGLALGVVSATVLGWGLGVLVAVGLIVYGGALRYDRPTVRALELVESPADPWAWPSRKVAR